MPPQDVGAKSSQAELITSKKREILPMEGEAIFHGERHEALVPNARSVNDLGKPSAQEYNCQFAEISPAIRQNKITHQRKSSARRSCASADPSAFHPPFRRWDEGWTLHATGAKEPGDSPVAPPDEEVITSVRWQRPPLCRSRPKTSPSAAGTPAPSITEGWVPDPGNPAGHPRGQTTSCN